ncbi:MAG TPA: DciA family protein [Methylophilaceae bacterium]|nr:DciA family protein [Methylophilaceae bacterium]
MQRFNALFKENAELVTLSERANNLTASQKIWNSAVPDALRPFTRAGAVKHKRLTVYADNGAVAAKIKFLLPSLLIRLQKQGLEVTAIRIEVQVKSTPRKSSKNARTVPAQAAASLQALAVKLGDSELSAVLARLARRK